MTRSEIINSLCTTDATDAQRLDQLRARVSILRLATPSITLSAPRARLAVVPAAVEKPKPALTPLDRARERLAAEGTELHAAANWARKLGAKTPLVTIAKLYGAE